jgi:alanyl aminopeptidase
MSRRLLLVAGIVACGPRPTAPIPLKPEPAIVDATLVEPPPPAALEPPQPTLRLPKNFVPAHYAPRLVIDPSKPTFDGAIAITGDVAERSAVIWLHAWKLDVTSAIARAGGREVPLVATPRGEDLLELRAQAPLDPGRWTLALEFRGRFEAIATTGVFRQTVAGASYVYTQFESTFARRAFPCVDEPDTKVPWKLTLDVPKHLVAVANTPPEKEDPLGADLKRIEFATTRPMPSYLVAFGVGPFEIVDAGKSRTGVPIRILTLARRAAEGAWAAKTTAPLLEALEDWFGTPYPYEKLDMLAIPITVGFGAMENAGLVTFTETLILHDPVKASKERQHRWVVVAAHEIAHQWFGNLVTMQYWDDIWLNEGFASWMAAKVTAKIDPTYRDDAGELETRNGALHADALVSARRIRQPIETPDDIYTAFDGITYSKGASVLNMFERHVGAATFQQGVRDYLKARAWGNATSKDFVSAIATAANGKAGDIEAAFSSFLDRPGAPELTATIACDRGSASVALAQRRYVPPGAPAPAPQSPWLIPVCVAYDKAGTRGEACTMLAAETGTLELPSKTCPRWVMPNVDGRGYFRTAYTTAQVTALRDEAWDKLSWNERRAVYFDVETAVTTGRLSLQLGLSFIPKLLAGNDRFTIRHALGLATGLEGLVPDNLRDKYEYWLRAKFGPGATQIGFAPKDTDSLDSETTRSSLVGAVAWHGRDGALIAEAVRLADRWRELPHAIRGLVLKIAVDARPDLFEQIRREVVTEPDRKRRLDMIHALGQVRDPIRRRRALELVLDPKLDIRETQALLFDGSTDANRAAGRAFFRQHEQALIKRVPASGPNSSAAGFAYLFTNACKADERDAIAAYVTKTFAGLAGGPRTVKQAIEGMDQCIARRKLLETEVKAWLAGIRILKGKK